MQAELTFPVRYAETDAMGVVHHASYIVWFEAGRVEWLRQAGLDYAEVERSGLYFTVAEVHARYRSSARFGQAVTIQVALGGLRSRGLHFDYTVREAVSRTVLVEGYTRHVCIDHSGRVMRIPAELIARLER